MEKFYLDHIDIMQKFGCGKDRAYAIIRSIKSVSDTLNLAGKVTIADFEAWYNKPLKKDNMSSLGSNVV